MSDTTAIIIAVISSGALSALISAIANLIGNAARKKSVQNRALSMLLLRDIQLSGAEILQQTKIDADDFKQFEESYKIYKELGGNGYADKVMNEVARLPLSK